MPPMSSPSDAPHDLRSNLWKITAYSICLHAIMSVPTIVLFWQSHGMNMTQVMELQALFAIAIVLLEVPSGYVADVIGRRKTLIFAACANSCAIIVYSQGHGFLHFLIAELLFATGFSLISGADAAMIYDTLAALGEETHYQKYYGRIVFYTLCSIAVASVIGGWLSAFSLRLPFYATIPFFLMAVLIAMTLREPPRKQLSATQGYWQELARILRHVFVENAQLRWLIIYGGVLIGVNNAAVWLYQPYFQHTGMPLAYFGVAFASYQVVASLSSKYAYKIERRIGANASLISFTCCIATGYLLMGGIIGQFSFMLAFFHQFVRGFSQIVMTDYVNHYTESDVRATVLSAKNLLIRLSYAIIILPAGKIADLTTVVDALNVLGIVALLSGSALLVVLRKQRMI